MEDELVAFLRARLDEDRTAASTAMVTMNDTGEWTAHEVNGLVTVKERAYYVVATDVPPEMGNHIARNDPARRLRDVDSGTRTVDLAESVLSAERDLSDADPGWRAIANHLRQVLRLLALSFADHPDYNQEWQPR